MLVYQSVSTTNFVWEGEISVENSQPPPDGSVARYSLQKLFEAEPPRPGRTSNEDPSGVKKLEAVVPVVNTNLSPRSYLMSSY